VRPLNSLVLDSASEPLFFSDVHLGEQCPLLTAPFLAWLDKTLVFNKTIFILGDLFNAWIGDDLLEQDRLFPETVRAARAVCQSLKAFTEAGGAAYFMAGNRDFLIGPNFCKRSGLRPLAQECLLQFAGRRWLLCHGDHLCIDDRPHQDLRSRLLSPEWQAEFLATSLASRADFANTLREKSQAAKAMKAEEIMDVNRDESLRRIRHHECIGLIHGHTHRPGSYPMAEGLMRWVIPDWYARPNQEKYAGLDSAGFAGGFLRLTGAGPELIKVS
jgi:UDP-2,3-diacylglucosamine hydrolase